MKEHKSHREHEEQESVTDSSAENDTRPERTADENEAIENTTGESGWEEKLAVVNDKYLRLVAEFDNFRKRMAKERIELIMRAGEDVIGGLLPILDDFERALDAMQTYTASGPEQEGVQLIYDKLYNYVQSKGLQRIKAIGMELDTDLHEAIAKTPAPTPDLKGKIVDEVEPGYTLNGKVIRYAKVVVGE